VVTKTKDDKVLDTPAEPMPEPEPEPESQDTIERRALTDLGNAERFVSTWGHMVRYSYERKKWLTYTGKQWEWDSGAQTARMAALSVRDIYAEAYGEEDSELRTQLAKHALHSENDSRITAMLNLSHYLVSINIDRLDRNGWLFNCNNGTIDLKTGKLLPHHMNDYISILAPVNYNPDAKCPKWLEFMHFLTNGDTELQAYLQRAVGYSLTGETSAQVIFMLYGLGSNGKSTFTTIIRKLVAGYGDRLDIDDLLMKDRGANSGPKDGIASLANKRFVLASEIPDNKNLNVGLVKDLSGEDSLKVRRLYEHGFEFRPSCKLWLYGNHKPVIKDTTLSIWRRVKLIKCDSVMPEENRIEGYGEKYLDPELEGILAWAVAGCLSWQKQGLGSAEAIKTATASYQHDSDILGDFMEDCCVIEAGATVAKSELKTRYHDWCQENGIEPITQRTFKSRLTEKGITDGRIGAMRFWRGIRLLMESDIKTTGDKSDNSDNSSDKSDKSDAIPLKSYTREITKGTLWQIPPKCHSCHQKDTLPPYPEKPCPKCGSEWMVAPDGDSYICEKGHRQGGK